MIPKSGRGDNAPQLKASMENILKLDNYDIFTEHPWIVELKSKYIKESRIAAQGVARLMDDLECMNQDHNKKNGRVLFTSIEGRVKQERSFFRKLFVQVCEQVKTEGLSPKTLETFYADIKDLAGVRFSCPYYDEIEHAINGIVRPFLSIRGYATNLKEDHYKDKNHLDNGDGHGYRSYHFFVKVPALVDIFGGTEMFLCEVQARSELQHVWAVKSHNLLYKPEEGWVIPDGLLEDMRQVSNSLRSADHFLAQIKNNVRGKSNVTREPFSPH